jgi:hypothetical protein
MLKFISNRKKITKTNRSISIFFIWFTALTFGSSLLAPAVNTLSFVYGINLSVGWSLFASTMVGAGPQVAFVVLCLLTCFNHKTTADKKKKQLEVQLGAALFLSIWNCFCMLLFLVRMIIKFLSFNTL